MRNAGSLLLAVTFVGTTACAHVRTTQNWPDLVTELHAGSRVALTDSSGLEVRGRVVSISPRGVEIDQRGARRAFAATGVREVRRDGDPIWNGLLIGAAVGVIGAMLPDARCGNAETGCHNAQVPERVLFFALSTGAGALLDAAHKDRSLLYQAPRSVHVAPLVSAHGGGVLILVRF